MRKRSPTRRISRISCSIGLFVSPFMLAAPALGDPAPFELSGPDLSIEVTRGGQTLPISRVPSLAVGDKVVVHGAFPESQGANFVLMSAFLRGATNPPPKDWIDLARTWKEKEKDKALTLTVPRDARQMVLLMVPETGGAEGVLMDAVRGKPGEFVRASQDLNQASLDHSRLNAFMAAIRAQDDSGPEYLRTVAPVLASSLSIKLQEDCLNKVIQSQASCLVENRDSLVLTDVHTSSLAETITGTPTDLALQLANTREGGAGYYSAYIAVARDVAKIFGAFNNPQFNYLPTLTVRNADRMSLLLNAAPSFKKPKSVMIAAMPAVEADIPPQLRSTAKGPICMAQGAVLPVEGAPLMFSTDFAHDMKVRLTSASGQVLEVPVKARADKGGYVLAVDTLPAAFAGDVRGHLHGIWGFAPFDGPDYLLQRAGGDAWKAAGDADGLIVGRDNDVALEGMAPGCVEDVTLRQGNGAGRPLKFKAQEGRRLNVTVPLADAAAGDVRLEIRERGVAEAQTVTLRARVQASRLDALELHAGDAQGFLTGQRLDQVRSVMLGDVEFRPDELTREGGGDRLHLIAQGTGKVPNAAAVPDKATVKLEDGRNLTLPVRIAAPRPQVALLQRTVYPGPAVQGTKTLDIGSGDLLPDNGEMVFSLKAAGGARFGAGSAIEIAPAQGESIARLEIGKGLSLESPEVVVATLRAADLPPATFGAIRLRFVSKAADGREERGDWMPLTTVVRLPRIESVTCEGQDGPCTVAGRNLFLIDAVAVEDGFAKPATVQPGYTGRTLQVSGRPADGALRLRLRDAPASVVKLALDK
ncbi:hypothetical protein BES08_00440 [Novosphingobium resinovorum]|uniref:Uncharacterized protein n=2 Tax=Novosphingobium resinovorum TaxID=158500 RepID=A0A1D7ZZU6_9SPHN|nr:hypothetical protein BES08_00440 [Novosphingobium resinovorum]